MRHFSDLKYFFYTILFVIFFSSVSNSQNISLGCTDLLACNYDSLATINDGSCIFPILAPYHEDFSAGILPLGFACSWSQSAVVGDGWRFDGLPGYAAAQNGRDTGTFAWVDFSNQDIETILEIETIDMSNLTLPGIFFDYFSYVDTFGTSPPVLNTLNLEIWNGSMWILLESYQVNLPGWNTQFEYLTNAAYINDLVKIRFRAESSVGSDYFNDLLIDDIKIMEVVLGCSDSLACNYNPQVNIDDNSCFYPDGCTDSLACNFSATATCNDGSCCYDSPTISIAVTECDFYLWNGNIYNNSGTYNHLNTNSCGCDSIIILNLWLNNTDSVTILDTAYNSYNWNSQVITNSGLYTDVFTNSAGCDSVVTLNLTILNCTEIIETNNKKKLMYIITDNILGQKTKYRNNFPLYYIYNNGTVEKKIIIE